MQTFSYVKAASIDKALASACQAKFIAGGTTLVDLMKLSVETPKTLVDINLLPLDKIEKLPDGGLRIGAMVRNSDLAWNADVQKSYAVLSRGASLRRFAAAAQHGDDRRQPAAAHALRLLPRAQRRHARRLWLQQAHARHGLRGARRLQSHPRHSRHQRSLHRDPSFGHVRGHGRARSGRFTSKVRRASGPLPSPTSTSCPATRRTSRMRSSPAN